MARPPNLTPLTPEQQALTAPLLGMARDLASVAARDWPQIADDFESNACLALVESVRTWGALSVNGPRPCMFKSYAYRAVKWRLGNAVRDTKPKAYRHREGPAPKTLRLDNDTWLEVTRRTTQPDFSLDDLDEFEALISPMKARSRDILRMRFIEELEQEEIGERIGVGRSRIGRLLEDAIATLGEILRLKAERQAAS